VCGHEDGHHLIREQLRGGERWGGRGGGGGGTCWREGEWCITIQTSSLFQLSYNQTTTRVYNLGSLPRHYLLWQFR